MHQNSCLMLKQIFLLEVLGSIVHWCCICLLVPNLQVVVTVVKVLPPVSMTSFAVIVQLFGRMSACLAASQSVMVLSCHMTNGKVWC